MVLKDTQIHCIFSRHRNWNGAAKY